MQAVHAAAANDTLLLLRKMPCCESGVCVLRTTVTRVQLQQQQLQLQQQWSRHIKSRDAAG
jgi:hypothetical protein